MNCTDCGGAISREDSYRLDSAGPHHLPTITCTPCVETVELAMGSIVQAVTAAPTERQAILDEARQIISSDRNSTYGEPEANHARIAALWSVYLEHDISPRQAALCMALVKIAREIHAPKRDNLVDLAGYAAVAGEL